MARIGVEGKLVVPDEGLGSVTRLPFDLPPCSSRHLGALVAGTIVTVALCLSAAIGRAAPVQQVARGTQGFLGVTPISDEQARKIDTLLHALRNGNAVRVTQVADALGLNAVSKKMLRARLSYKMPQLMTLAEQCQVHALAKLLARAAVRCNTVAFGAARIMGDARAMLKALAWAKETGFSLEAKLGQARSAKISRALLDVDPSKLIQTVPPLRAHISTHQAVLPISNWRQTHRTRSTDSAYMQPWTSPQVAVTVNAVSANALVDTGSMIALTMGATEAARLHVRTLITGLTAIRTLNKPTMQRDNASLGLIDSFTFGPLTLHNVAVAIVPDAYADLAPITVGLPVLARFKHVTFTTRAILLNDRTDVCPDPLPMTYAAPATNQLGHLIFTATTGDGIPVHATFDTGLSTLLLAGTKLAHRSRALDAGAVLNHARRGYLAVVVPGGRIASYNAAFTSILPSPPDVLVGIPLLRTAKVSLTFSPLILCMTSKNGRRKRATKP